MVYEKEIRRVYLFNGIAMLLLGIGVVAITLSDMPTHWVGMQIMIFTGIMLTSRKSKLVFKRLSIAERAVAKAQFQYPNWVWIFILTPTIITALWAINSGYRIEAMYFAIGTLWGCWGACSLAYVMFCMKNNEPPVAN